MKISYFERLSQFVLRKSAKEQKVSDEIIQKLLEHGYKSNEDLLKEFNTSLEGLTKEKSHDLLIRYGPNEIIHERRKPFLMRLLLTFKNPLIILLGILVVISFFTGDIPTASIISIMITVSVVLRFTQEEQAYNAAEKLSSMVKTTCAVIYDGKVREIDVKYVVPGDIVQLAAGDIVPGDMRLLTSRDLFINQSALTGESLPVEKYAPVPTEKKTNPLELHDMCFMGTNVETGSAQGIILATGSSTYFGNLAKSIEGQRVETSFDKGVDKFTWLMIWFMLAMTPTVFLINGFGKGNWWEAFLFAISVAVGLTPEMLPAIVAVNLSKGSVAMSKKKVIVKRLSSIQNFGAMNVLCTDKTGTLTANKIALIENINIDGKTDEEILHYAFLNSYYQTGFRNLLDDAVLLHVKATKLATREAEFEKVDELPF
ncbi:MAG: HAD-IC family P-type ATPase, partial [Patescibacteria group bacterium]|nr:HAD-IC family P-type ATPase [Patescibacteria group bacterium]